MMQQYQDAKAACEGAILLFRMGDFYEMFFDDAKTAARVLNLALTSREKGENAIPMAGFPYHQLESYLGRLIAAGLRVAVCDQVEDARQAKGLVRRDVTRIVSAGTLTDECAARPAGEQLSGGRRADRAGRHGLGRSVDRFVPGRLFSAGPAGRRTGPHCRGRGAVGRRQRLAAAAGRRQPACHAAAGLGVCRPGGGAVAGPPFRDRHRSRVLVSTTPICRPFARPARCWSIWSKRRNRRWPTSTGLEHYSASERLQIDEVTRRSLELTRTLARRPPRGFAAGRARPHRHCRWARDCWPNGWPIRWPTSAAIDQRLDAVAELVGEPRLWRPPWPTLCVDLRPGAACRPGDDRPGQSATI